jgi:three-Cys-motif partner protein
VTSEEALFVADDGMPCGEVGSWTETKHRLVSLYAELFSSGMRNKWDRRVYLELYAGAGHSRIRGTSRIILGSPLRALKVKQPFDKYVFCEENPESLDALEKRVQAASNAEVSYVAGDCNDHVDDILAEIPPGSRGDTVLTLCFADPFDISLKFKTLERLSRNRFMDFVVLLAVHSDAGRAYKRYLMEDSVKVDEFLGPSDGESDGKP